MTALRKMKFGTKSILVKDGKVLLMRRSNYDGYRAGEWDIPGGRIDAAEGYEEGHKREVFEETKLAIEIISELNRWKVERPDGKHIGVTYISRHVSGEVVLSNEHTEYMWVSPEEVQTMEVADWIKRDTWHALMTSPSLFAKDL